MIGRRGWLLVRSRATTPCRTRLGLRGALGLSSPIPTDARHCSTALSKLSVGELKSKLTERGIDFSGCFEKHDLVERLEQAQINEQEPKSTSQYTTDGGYFAGLNGFGTLCMQHFKDNVGRVISAAQFRSVLRDVPHTVEEIAGPNGVPQTAIKITVEHPEEMSIGDGADTVTTFMSRPDGPQPVIMRLSKEGIGPKSATVKGYFADTPEEAIRILCAEVMAANRAPPKPPDGRGETSGLTEGTYIFADGMVYVGELKDGLPEGRGRSSDEHNVYDGEFKAGNKEGHGTMRYADGTVYEGAWVDGHFEGHGKMRYANGFFYEGTFKGSMKDGRGTMRYPDGGSYEGEWLKDTFNGQGRLEMGQWAGTGATSTILEGLFVANNLERGKVTFANGDVYEGAWRNNGPHGEGRFTSADGSVQEEGTFVDGYFKS